jgi:hypothetical protein
LDLKRISDEVLDKKIKNYPLVKKYDSCQEHVLNAEMEENRGIEVIFTGMKCNIHPDKCSRIIGYNIAEKCSYHVAHMLYQFGMSIMTPCLKKNRIYISGKYIEEPKPRSIVPVYEVDLKTGTKTLYKHFLPTGFSCLNIHSVLACAEKVYVIVSCQVAQKCRTVMLEQAKNRNNKRRYLFDGNVSDVLACAMEDKKICILYRRVGENQETMGNSASFFVYDIATGRRYDHSKCARWDTLMLPVGDEIIVTSIGKHSCTRYSSATGEWIHKEEQFLSFPTQPFDNTEYMSSSDGNNFYLFRKGSSSENWCYNFIEKKWKKLESYIEGRRSAACLMQIPCDLPLCHILCPHCKIKNRTTPRCQTCLR